MGAFAQFCILLHVLFLFSLLGEIPTSVNAEYSWCTAKPSSSEDQLEKNIQYLCSQGLVNCTPIQEGGECFYPNTSVQHASYLMNLYYQSHGREVHTCSFNDSGLIGITDPSFDECTYEGGDGEIQQEQWRWLVAKPATDETLLKSNIDYICSQSQFDCRDIEEGNACFTPNTPLNHASYVMNLYLHNITPPFDSYYDFKKSGLISLTDPSYGLCAYVASKAPQPPY